MIKVSNLTVYSAAENSKIYLLKDISFQLNKGESLGIIGKSGDGKSTLAKALLEIYDSNVFYEKGTIEIDNKKFIKDFRGKRISLLFQNPNTYLNPLMSVGKQISEMLTYHFKEKKKIAKEKTLEFMKKVGLKDADILYNYFPYELSGGMQQKVCLCIALICKPDIVILDESTSFLDENSKKDILSLLKISQKETNFTLIMISHDLKEIYNTCDKIAVMRKGKMIEFGKKDEIILNPIHPYTMELLIDYLRFYANIDDYKSPDTSSIESPITMISDTHYVRYLFNDKNKQLPENFQKTKEIIYENLRN